MSLKQPKRPLPVAHKCDCLYDAEHPPHKYHQGQEEELVPVKTTTHHHKGHKLVHTNKKVYAERHVKLHDVDA